MLQHQVQVDDQVIGQLDGLKFTPSKTSSALEAEAIRTTAEKIVTPEINRRMTSLCGGVHTIFTLSKTGGILWGGKIVGRPDGFVHSYSRPYVASKRGLHRRKSCGQWPVK